ncbi:lipopolysaccharide biosynthesis protein [Pseudaestuariivita rosea]|uniref:lipopolysaccharide biosynthesis protein n=1 Tax=Pseudaestuariivita rosea TaxID=2763263 RepID=UPI001ABAE51D|nr:lipopolysaccharide biosynthesis protein [Pseudaestuariivita rosea]
MTDTVPNSTASDDGHFGHLRKGRSIAALKGVFWSAINTVVPTLVTALVFLLSSRLLTPFDFGVVALATSMVSFAVALAPAAFAEALVQRSQIEARHTDSVFWLCMGAAVLLFFPYLIFAGWLAGWADEPLLQALLPFLGLKILFDLGAAVPTMLLVRVMKFRQVAMRTAIASLCGAGVCIALLLTGFGLWALAASQITTSFVTMVVAFWTSGWRPGRTLHLSALRDLLKYGTFTTGDRFLNLFNIDQLLIGLLVSPAILGLFNFAQRLFALLNNLIAGALSSVSHSVLSSMQAEPEKMRQTFLMSSYASSVVAFPLFAGLAVVAPQAVPLLFGAQWTPAVLAVQAFCVIGIMASISIPQAALIKSQNKAQWWFFYQLVQKLGNVAVILATFTYGLDAILIGIAAKTVLIWPVSVYLTCRLLQTGALRYLISYLPPVLATLAMGVVVYLLPGWLDLTPGWASLCAQVAGGIVLYAILITALSVGKLRHMIRILKNARGAA